MGGRRAGRSSNGNFWLIIDTESLAFFVFLHLRSLVFLQLSRALVDGRRAVVATEIGG